jgi:S-adenosylmethionine decarboxylase
MDGYKFEGLHWLATFRQVEVFDNVKIKQVVERALKESGANIVGYTEHVFENGAITFCFLLGESHCTLHTYPEVKSMWIDCFTCGISFDLKKFDGIMTYGLRAGFTETRIIRRH